MEVVGIAHKEDFTGAKKEDFHVVRPGENNVPEPVEQPEAPKEQEPPKPEPQPTPEPPKVEPPQAAEAPKPEPVKETPIQHIATEPVKKSREEQLKDLGLDEFDIELIEYRKKTGDVTPYLEAKTVNYKDMSAEDIMKRNLQRMYPSLKGEAFDLLYREEVIDKYKLDPDVHEGVQAEVGKARLGRDAEVLRQQFLTEQAKFKAPDANPDAEAQKQQEALQREIDNYRQMVTTNAATQTLLQSKKLVFDGGKEGFRYTFEAEKPQDIVDILLDGSKWQQMMNGQDGKPDFAKMLRVAAYAMNETSVVHDLMNSGKSLGGSEIIKKDFENATPTDSVTPATEELSLAQAFHKYGKKSWQQ